MWPCEQQQRRSSLGRAPMRLVTLIARFTQGQARAKAIRLIDSGLTMVSF